MWLPLAGHTEGEPRSPNQRPKERLRRASLLAVRPSGEDMSLKTPRPPDNNANTNRILPIKTSTIKPNTRIMLLILVQIPRSLRRNKIDPLSLADKNKEITP